MKVWIQLVLSGLILSGCGITEPMRKSESHLSRLELGSGKSDVARILGPADRVRASKRLDDGHVLELHEYDIYGKHRALADALLCPITLTLSCWIVPRSYILAEYWLQYVDGKLDRWGKAGDWQASVTGDFTIHHDK